MEGLLLFLVARIVLMWMALEMAAYRNKLDMSQVARSQVDIPMNDGWNMAALVFKPKGSNKESKLPTIIFHHGITGSKEDLLSLAVPITMHGYLSIIPDARGHGESKERLDGSRPDDYYIDESTGIVHDLVKIVDYVETRDDVDMNRVFIIGHSMGGLVALNHGVQDPRIRKVISIAGIYETREWLAPGDGKFNLNEWFSRFVFRFMIDVKKMIAMSDQICPKRSLEELPRGVLEEKVFVIHCEDDKIAPFRNSTKMLLSDFPLPMENVFILDHGDHGYLGQDAVIVAKILEWIS